MSVPAALLDAEGRASLLDFYGEVFGWTEMPTLTEDGRRLVLRAHSNEQFVFLLGRETSPSATALAHVALRVTIEEFYKSLAALVAHGIGIDEGPRKRGSGRSVYFKDPWGNQIELHHP